MLPDISIMESIQDYFTPERVSLVVRVVLILCLGIPLVRLLRKLVRKLVKDRLSFQSEQLVVRAVYYISILIIVISVLNEFGFKLSALLGAAGVFGIAIGFASQTSVSNIISGIFLISEKPFVIGDTVQIGQSTGTIVSIDLLSIKLKTEDGKFVRVPNETMIKNEVVNATKYSSRRVNINVGVSYNSELPKVLRLLQEIAESHPLALKDPEPLIQIDSFGESGVNIKFGVWTNQENVIILRNALMLGIKERFDIEKIEIPYPHVTIVQEGERETNNTCI